MGGVSYLHDSIKARKNKNVNVHHYRINKHYFAVISEAGAITGA